jgi:ABC-2 type transport system ATP-binding protein
MTEVSEPRKRYGPAEALAGMTFTALPGRVTGFAGPNGTGKTTTVGILGHHQLLALDTKT